MNGINSSTLADGVAFWVDCGLSAAVKEERYPNELLANLVAQSEPASNRLDNVLLVFALDFCAPLAGQLRYAQEKLLAWQTEVLATSTSLYVAIAAKPASLDWSWRDSAKLWVKAHEQLLNAVDPEAVEAWVTLSWPWSNANFGDNFLPGSSGSENFSKKNDVNEATGLQITPSVTVCADAQALAALHHQCWAHGILAPKVRAKGVGVAGVLDIPVFYADTRVFSSQKCANSQEPGNISESEGAYCEPENACRERENSWPEPEDAAAVVDLEEASDGSVRVCAEKTAFVDSGTQRATALAQAAIKAQDRLGLLCGYALLGPLVEGSYPIELLEIVPEIREFVKAGDLVTARVGIDIVILWPLGGVLIGARQQNSDGQVEPTDQAEPVGRAGQPQPVGQAEPVDQTGQPQPVGQAEPVDQTGQPQPIKQADQPQQAKPDCQSVAISTCDLEIFAADRLRRWALAKGAPDGRCLRGEVALRRLVEDIDATFGCPLAVLAPPKAQTGCEEKARNTVLHETILECEADGLDVRGLIRFV